MTIRENLLSGKSNAELTNSNLNCINAYNAYINNMQQLQDREQSIKYDNMKYWTKNFSSEIYPKLNAEYKSKVCGLNPNSNHNNLYVKTLNNHKMKYVIANQFTDRFQLKHTDNKNYKKYVFTDAAVSTLISMTYSFLEAAGKRYSVGHLRICCVKSILEYFDLFDIDWVRFADLLNLFETTETSEISTLRNFIEFLKINYSDIKPKGRPTGLKYKKKIDKIDIEEISEYLKNHPAQETKKYFAEKYNVSISSIEKIMKKNNLSRNYKKR